MTKEQASISIANELLQRLDFDEHTMVSSYDLKNLDAVLVIAVHGRRCYTSLVRDVLYSIDQLLELDAEAGEDSWIFGQDKPVKAHAKRIKAKAEHLLAKYSRPATAQEAK